MISTFKGVDREAGAAEAYPEMPKLGPTAHLLIIYNN